MTVIWRSANPKISGGSESGPGMALTTETEADQKRGSFVSFVGAWGRRSEKVSGP
jgi:hypothetical protein